MEFRNAFNFFLSFGFIYLVAILIPAISYVFQTFAVTLFEIKLAVWLMEKTRKHFLYKRVCPKNKAVLITGCDSGFGNALARRMDKLGYFVYATCLNPDGEGAKKLSEECSKKLIVLPMDVTDDRSIKIVVEHIEKNLNKMVLWAIVNNAGIVHVGQVDWTSFEELQQVYNVNTAGTLRVTKAFIPFLKKSKGRIINVTSLAARYSLPGMVGYCMSKSASSALTTGLRVELAQWKIKSISIEPHLYSTPMAAKKTVYSLVEKAWLSAPKEVREEYDEDYIEYLKKVISFVYMLFLENNIQKVIDDLEDAITAEEPLSIYISASTAQKFVVSLLQTLPSGFNESLQKILLRVKHPALILNKEKAR